MTITDCPICYETFTNDNFINCPNNHIACCIDCFSKLSNNNCPICRNPLNNETTTTTTTITTTTTSRLPRLRIQREARETITARMGSPRQRPDSNYDSNISNLIANHRETLNNRQIAQRRRREREVREEEEAFERILDMELEALAQEEIRINNRRNEILSTLIR